jgi:hypothetical protein
VFRLKRKDEGGLEEVYHLSEDDGTVLLGGNVVEFQNILDVLGRIEGDLGDFTFESEDEDFEQGRVLGNEVGHEVSDVLHREGPFLDPVEETEIKMGKFSEENLGVDVGLESGEHLEESVFQEREVEHFTDSPGDVVLDVSRVGQETRTCENSLRTFGKKFLFVEENPGNAEPETEVQNGVFGLKVTQVVQEFGQEEFVGRVEDLVHEFEEIVLQCIERAQDFIRDVFDMVT